MRHYYKSHGKHCFLRSFVTSCPKCGADVLYWECKHGSKVFFQYPVYGKLIRHFCRRSQKVSNQKNKFQVVIKTPSLIFKSLYINCPICGKPFKNRQNLKDHFKASKKSDREHRLFLNDQLKFEEDFNSFNNKKRNKNKSDYKPKFGRINIKKK